MGFFDELAQKVMKGKEAQKSNGQAVRRKHQQTTISEDCI